MWEGAWKILSLSGGAAPPDLCDVSYLVVSSSSLLWTPVPSPEQDWSRLVERSEWNAGNHSHLPHYAIENMPSLTSLSFFGAGCCQAVLSWQLCRWNKRPIRPKMICKQWRRRICHPAMSDSIKNQNHFTCGWRTGTCPLKHQLHPYAEVQEKVLSGAGFSLTPRVFPDP